MGTKHSTAKQRDTKTREEPIAVRGGRRHKTRRGDTKNKRRRVSGGRVKAAVVVGVGVAAAALALAAALARSKSKTAPPSSGDYTTGDEASRSTAIAFGRSGCVFRPALRCAGKTATFPEHVTKLGSRESSEAEWALVESIKERLITISDWKNYFILPDDTCTPVLNTRGFRATCPVIYTVSPDDLHALQVPDGGRTINDFLTSKVEFLPFWTAMKSLLRHGIVPMNTAGIIHRDVKFNNIVSDPVSHFARLIDWDAVVDVNNFDALRFTAYFEASINQPYAYSFLSSEIQELLGEHQMSCENLYKNLNVFIDKILIDGQLPPYAAVNEISRTKYENGLSLVQSLYGYARGPGTTTVDYGENARDQVDKICEKFCTSSFKTTEYLELLRTNYDVYGWLTTILYCFAVFPSLFSDHARYTFHAEPAVKAVLLKYVYNPAVLCAPYNVEKIIAELDLHVRATS